MTPTSMPSTLVAGQTVSLSLSEPDYPASAGWSLTLYLNPRSGGIIRSVTSTASGDDHLLQATATTTATWAVGSYGWEVWASLGAARHRVDGGQLEMRAALLSAVAGTDTRSAAEVALDAVRSMIRGTATAGVMSYSIAGRELRRYSIPELLQLESKLSQDVLRERDAAGLAAGLKSRRKIAVRMGRA
jgi:hypothetical protein